MARPDGLLRDKRACKDACVCYFIVDMNNEGACELIILKSKSAIIIVASSLALRRLPSCAWHVRTGPLRDARALAAKTARRRMAASARDPSSRRTCLQTRSLRAVVNGASRVLDLRDLGRVQVLLVEVLEDRGLLLGRLASRQSISESP